MMLVDDILAQALDVGVYLYVEEGKLKFTAQSTLPESLLVGLKAHKPEVIARLIELEQQSKNTKASGSIITPVERNDSTVLPLSFAQQRLWFLAEFMGPSAVYNMPLAVRLNHDIDCRALLDSLEHLQMRHESLRTRFVSYGELQQNVCQQVDATIEPIRVEYFDDAAQLKSSCQAFCQYAFDLSREKLCKIRLLCDQSDGEQRGYVLLILLHHGVSDGWSSGILVQELTTLYAAFSQGQPSPLAPLSIQYGDYAVWQRDYLQGPILSRQIDYWREQLKGLPPQLSLPTDRARPRNQSFNGSTEQLALPAQLSAQLKHLSQTQGVTLFVTLISAFGVLLSRYSGQQDIAIGTPIANRSRQETESLIGFFANTLVMRLDAQQSLRFSDLLQRTKNMAYDGYAHQDVPFEQLVEQLSPERSMAHSPLFQVLFALQNVPQAEHSNTGLQMQPLTFDDGQAITNTYARFDLTLNMQETIAGISAELEYNTDLFNRTTIVAMLEHLQRILQAVCVSPDVLIGQIELLSEAAKVRQLQQCYAAPMAYDGPPLLHQLFEAQVAKTPDAVAVYCQQQQLSYRQLNDRANRLAHQLIEQGIKPQSRVGLCVERGITMLVGLLATLKAGGCYVPLDPNYPEHRLAYVIDHSGIELVLTQQQVLQSLDVANLVSLACEHVANPRVLATLLIDESDIETGPELKDPAVVMDPQNLAYIIYTSGSTGRPKGVCLPHSNVVNFLTTMAQRPGLLPTDRLLAVTTLSFDIAVLELYLPLCVGAAVDIASQAMASDGQQLAQSIKDRKVTVMQATPVTWKLLLESGWQGAASFKALVGGEAFSGTLAKQLLPLVSSLWNMYGPTETTVWSLIHPVDSESALVPIGRGIARTDLFILDNQMNLCPDGVIGELYIGGAGVAQGYYQQSALTAQQFVPNPFATTAGDRLYRSGDLVYRSSNGCYNYVSRADSQVKIRGFRIELGEIEQLLASDPQVKDVVAMVVENDHDDKRIVAYIVPHSLLAFDPLQLRALAQSKLPTYMVPSGYVELAQMPLTNNGKIDRKALPKPPMSAYQQNYVEPQGESEIRLAQLWVEVLKCDRVGRSDNFFNLGGHSLLVTQLLSRINQAFTLNLSIAELFENQTLIQQAQLIATASAQPGEAQLPLLSDGGEGPYPLSFAQQRLWFLNQFIGPNAIYNIPLALRLSGAVDSEALIGALQYIVARHQILRTRFVANGDEVQQIVDPQGPQIIVEAVHSQSALKQLQQHEREYHFDLADQPLCRIRLIQDLSDGEHYGSYVLLLTMHHSISDGWSLGVFFSELVTGYQQLKQQQPLSLPALAVQYGDFSRWQRQWLSGPVLQQQLAYWQQQLADLPPLLALPTQRPRPAKQTFNGRYQRLSLGAELSVALEQLSKEHGVTLYMTLLSGFSLLLGRLSDQQDVAIGTPIANRNHSQIEKLIGFFVNTLVMRIRLDPSFSFAQLLQQTRQVTLSAYANQDVPFEQLVESLEVERDVSHSPLFQVLFSLQNVPEDVAEVEQMNLAPLQFDDHAKDDFGVARFDLTLTLQQTANGIMGGVEYNVDLFSQSFIEQMLQMYSQLLQQLVVAPNSNIAQIPLLSEQQIASQWAFNQRVWQHRESADQYQGCIHQLLHTRVTELDSRLHWPVPGIQLTPLQLDNQGTALAQKLRDNGVAPQDTVALYLAQEEFLLVAALAVLKAGAQLLLLSPHLPNLQSAYQLNRAAAAWLLCTETERTSVADIVALSQLATEPQQLCQTKMMVVERAGLATLNSAAEQALPTVNEQQGALVGFLPTRDSHGNYGQQRLCRFSHQTLRRLVCAWRDELSDSQLDLTDGYHYLLTALASLLKDGWVDILAQPRSENTVVLHQSCPALMLPLLAVADTCILDSEQVLMPVGAVGELYFNAAIVGQDPALEGSVPAAELAASHRAAVSAMQFYPSGMLARYDQQGNLHILASQATVDKPVQWTAQLNQLQQALATHASVNKCCVVRKNHQGNDHCVAYVETAEGVNQDIVEVQLQAHLRHFQPGSVLPSAIVLLPQLPLDQQGQVDTKALPLPQAWVDNYQAPEGELEQILAAIWSQLLGVERVGRQDNFFKLGGHSLISVKLIEQLQRQGIVADVAAVFSAPNLAQLAATITEQPSDTSDFVVPDYHIPANQTITPDRLPLVSLSQPQIELIATQVSGGMANIQDIYPLAPLQEGILFQHMLNEQANTYVVTQVMSVANRVLLDQILAALQKVIDRHDILRSAIIWQQLSKPVQVVCRHAELPIETLQLEAEQTPLARLAQCMAAENLTMDLTQAPLYQAKLLADPDSEQWYLLLNYHHIISDEITQRLLWDEVVLHLSGDSTALKPAKRYRDYVAMAQYSGQQGLTEQYFKTTLGGIDEPTLPFGLSDVHGDGNHGEKHTNILNQQLSQQIRACAKANNVAPSTLFHLAWALVVAHCAGKDDVVFGSVLMGRTKDIGSGEQTLGMFINTLPLRLNLQQQSVAQLLQATHQQMAQLLKHEHASLVSAQQCSDIEGNAPLFNSVINYHAAATIEQQDDNQQAPLIGGMQAVGGQARSSYPLLITIDNLPEGFAITAEVEQSVAAQRVTGYLHNALSNIVTAMANAANTPFLQLNIIDQAEREQLLNSWNNTESSFDQQLCIAQLFERQVEKTPTQTALLASDRQLSFAELNTAANRLAHALIATGIGPECKVGVCLERTSEMLVAILAVLKSGGYYVPLDPDYPQDRLNYLIADSGIELLLTNQQASAGLQLPSKVSGFYLDQDWQQAQYSALNPPACSVPTNLAYIIYTSGSTGKPKGVGICHQGVVSLLNWANKQLTEQDRAGVLASTSMCFDLSIYEMFLPLCYGGSCIIIDNILSLADFAYKDQITLINTVPSAAKALLEQQALPNHLRVMNLAGEPLTTRLADALYQSGKVTQLFDLYGPSEDTTYSTFTLRQENGVQTIGRPVDNTRAYILDAQGQPVVQGVVGELYLGGCSLARGYINQPSLTAGVFVPDPFGQQPGGRLYRTGDLVRYLDDGNLVYVGRVDHQVKMHGFRIELGEIESQIVAHAGVKDAVVIVDDRSGPQRIAAYIVGEANYHGDEALQTLLQSLQKKLPHYMVPSAVQFIEAIPLTANGKLDRKALPIIDSQSQQHSYQPPITELEQQMCQIWQRIMGVAQIGLDDNFFSVGGDSILSIQVVSRAKAAGIDLSVKDLFKYPTVGILCRQLESQQSQRQALLIDQQPSSGELLLLPIHRAFFAAQPIKPGHYLQSQILNLPNDFDIAFLESWVAALYQRHDGLRVRYSGQDQRVAEFVPYDAQLVKQSVVKLPLTGADSQARLVQLARLGGELKAELDLAQGPLFKVVYCDVSDKERYLLLLLHHLLVDGVSWRILLQDLDVGYQQYCANQTIALAAKTTSYQQWAVRLSDYSRSAAALKQIPYWQSQIDQQIGQLPTDFEVVDQDRYSDGAQVSISLTALQTKQLLNQCNQSYRSQIQELLLSALVMAFYQWSGHSRLRLDLEGHGRVSELFDDIDLSETMGWFTSLYPLCLGPQDKLSGALDQQAIGDIIVAVKEQLRSIPDKGIGFGALHYLNDQRPLGADTPDYSPVIFNYLGQFDQQLSSQGRFSPAAINSGSDFDSQLPRQHLLGFNGAVTEGCLNFVIDYSRRRFKDSNIERLAACFQQSLERLIEHCLNGDFGRLTPSDFPLAKVSQQRLSSWQSSYPTMEDLYPATGSQMGLIFHSLLDQSQGAYATQMYLDFSGDFDPQLWRQAWQQLIARNAIFRTAIVAVDSNQPLQLVCKTAQLTWLTPDWQDVDEDALGQKFAHYRLAEKARGFDFATAPLMHMSLIRLSQDRYRWLWTHHHCLLDGWSMPLVFGELFALYRGLRQTKPVSLPTVVPYREYVAWVAEQDSTKAQQYWREALTGIEGPTALGIDKLPSDMTQEVAKETTHQLRLTEAQSQALQQLAKRCSVTLNIVIQAAWSYIMSRYSGEQRVIFGQTVSGRRSEVHGVERIMGLFINTLPVCIELDEQQSIAAWLQNLHQSQVERESFDYLPLAQIQRLSEVSGGQNLFNCLVVFENYPLGEQVQQQQSDGDDLGFAVDAMGSDEGTDYDLTLLVVPGEQLLINFDYRTEVFNGQSIERLSQHLAAVLDQLGAPTTDVATRNIFTLSYLSQAERQQILVDFNHTATPLPAINSISQWFEQQVDAAGQHCAVIYQSEQLSYDQLNRRANRLAHYLIAQGVAVDDSVGICFERSIEMVVALLAIVKAGASYLPIDPQTPQSRLQYVVENSALQLMLSAGDLALEAGLSGLPVRLIRLDSPAAWSNYPQHNPALALSGDNLAYVIYTSGSTGQPKGVGVGHQALINRIDWMQQRYQLQPNDRVLQKTPYSFDVSVWEFFWTLSCGATLVMAQPDGHKDAEYLADIIAANGITVLHFVPSMLDAFLGATQWHNCDSVRQVICSGEALGNDLQQRFFRYAKQCELDNLYGPTEAAIDVSYWRCQRDSPFSIVPIGKAIQNIGLYVVDRFMAPVPVGCVGELLIAGVGLARGYINRPDLTAERFMPNPLSGVAGDRVYRTGDLVRLLADGNIDYIGRIDFQVKLHGLRIELSEIEQCLLAHPAITAAAVVAAPDNNGNMRLLAYVVKSSSGPSGSELSELLNDHAATRLPAYMVPQLFIDLDALPLSSNGKLDRKALPQPQFNTEQTLVAPQNEIERLLVQLYQSVLGVEQLGVTDNFFTIGGDSILSIQLVSMAKLHGWAVSVKQLFNHPTVRALAKQVKPLRQGIEQSASEGTLALLPIHHWLLQQQTGHWQHFHQSRLIRLPVGFDQTFWTTFTSSLYQRHDALRLCYRQQDGHWQAAFKGLDPQWVEQSCCTRILPSTGEQQDLEFIRQQGAALKADFDLSSGPLFKSIYFASADGTGKCLLLVLHHLIVDGVSWRVLLDDLRLAFAQWQANKTIVLRDKTSSYQAWAQGLQGYSASASLQQQKAFWLAQLSLPVAPLPYDHQTRSQDQLQDSYHNVRQVTLGLSAEQTQWLLSEANERYRSQVNELLLAGLLLAFNRWNGQHSLRVDFEGHGREAELFGHYDLSETLGWFTAMYPLGFDSATIPDIVGVAAPQQNVARTIVAVKERLRQVPDAGLGFGVLRYLCQDDAILSAQNDCSSDILFNYLGRMDAAQGQVDEFAVLAIDTGADAEQRLRRSHALSFNGAVSQGCLQFAIDYSPAQFSEPKMVALADHYRQSLVDIIDHCRTTTEPCFTPSDFPLANVDFTKLSQWQRKYPRMADLYPATGMQLGLMFHSLLDQNNDAYATQMRVDFVGNFEPALFTQAWQQLMQRHSILRTVLVAPDSEQPLQLVLQQVDLPWQQQDWRHLDAQQQDLAFTRLRSSSRQFDFAKAPLMRMSLIRLADDKYRWLWTHHHCLLDGWSVPIIFAELLHYYHSGAADKPLQLQPAAPFVDYVSWLEAQDFVAADAFWREQLAGFDTPTVLGIDKLPLDKAHSGQQKQVLAISDERSAMLRAFSKQHGITLNTLVLSAWAYLLCRCSGDTDVVFGQTVSGRQCPIDGIEQMVGLFINTLPVRVKLSLEQPIGDWLQAMQLQQVERESYGFVPLVDIQKGCNMAPGQKLFNSSIMFENYPVGDGLKTSGSEQQDSLGFSIDSVQTYEGTEYGLALNARVADGLTLTLTYRGEEYAEATIAALLEQLEVIFAGFVAQQADCIGQLPYLSDGQNQQQLQWNNTAMAYPSDVCVAELFERQVAQNGDAIAVVCAEDSISYADLNSGANQLAHYLRKLGIGPDVPVGICAERSIEMIKGILAILKAGGCYVPLDPDYPPARLESMLARSGCRLVLTEQHLLEEMDWLSDVKTLPLDPSFHEMLLSAMPEDNISTAVRNLRPDNLAYVIYTSGSTGSPKGNGITQRNIVSLVCNDFIDYSIKPTMLCAASPSFDAFTFELWGALLNGGRAVLVELKQLAFHHYGQVMGDNQIDYAWLTSALFNQVINHAPHSLAGLKCLLIGGEALSLEHVRKALAYLPDTRIINGYGPTENTTFSCTNPINAAEIGAMSSVPIGLPLANRVAYVLDSRLQLVPVGCSGELYLGGDGLARGYLEDKGLTAKQFVPDPFSQTPGQRLYRSGDLVRRLINGKIEYLGRMDDQVKIRGFRIELEEIENCLLQHPQVRNAVVLVHQRQSSNPQLVAYVSGQDSDAQALSEDSHSFISELLSHCQAKLPQYMVPTVVMVVPEWPLTVNGKIDKKALPEPDIASQQVGYVAVQGEVEPKVAQLWLEILKLERVGRFDNFFDLGGHSLSATQLASWIREAFGVELSIREIFENQTVEQQSLLIEQRSQSVAANQMTITTVSRDQPILLSFAQQRLWFLHQYMGASSVYNIFLALRLRGDLDPQAMVKSLNAMVERHEILRTQYQELDGQVLQIITEAKNDIQLESIASTEQLVQICHQERYHPFDLRQESLCRIRLCADLNDHSHALIITLHHSIWDGWSMGIFFAELASLYEAFKQGQASPLEPLRLQYADFAHWQRQWFAAEKLAQQSAYWAEALAGIPSLLTLPTDRPRPPEQTFNGANYNVALPLPLSERIDVFCRAQNVTVFMTLMSSFALLLSRYSGQDDIAIGTPIANRTQLDAESLIGFFVNTIVMRTQLQDDPSFIELVAQGKETAMGGYEHQDIPFEQLVEVLNPERELSHTPLFQVMFALQNEPMEVIPLSDLSLTALVLEQQQSTAPEQGVSRFDLTFELRETPQGIVGNMEYNTDLFDRSTIERMVEHYEILLQQLLSKPQLPVSQLVILSQQQIAQQLKPALTTAHSDTTELCLHQRFVEQVRRIPHGLALDCDGWQMSYAELNQRANGLAHTLLSQGLIGQKPVALLFDNPQQLSVALLAVAKSGGCALVLEDTTPRLRNMALLALSEASLLLTQQGQAAYFTAQIGLSSDEGSQCRVIDMASLDRPLNSDDPAIEVAPDNALLQLFAGLGQPVPQKTLLSHRQVSQWLANGDLSDPGVTALLHHSDVPFDAVLMQIIDVLINGRCIDSYAEAKQQCQQQRQQLCDEFMRGEATPLLQQLDSPHPFIVATGKGQLLPAKVVGQLYLSADYLSGTGMGSMTLLSEYGSDQRWYGCGFNAYHDLDGQIYLVGRYNAEQHNLQQTQALSKVGAFIMAQPEIEQALVIERQDSPNNWRTVAYVVSNESEQTVATLSDRWRVTLRQDGAGSLLPATTIILDEMPLNAAGQVDIAALPQPLSADAQRQYVAPTSTTEQALCDIWAQALNLERVGVEDSFFALGGHSLLAVNLLNRIHTVFGVEIPIKAFFEHSSVKLLAQLIEFHQQTEAQATAPDYDEPFDELEI